jgi:hypothetical protein
MGGFMTRTLLLLLAAACGLAGCASAPTANLSAVLPLPGADNQLNYASYLSDTEAMPAEEMAARGPTTQPSTRPSDAQADADPTRSSGPISVADASRIFKETQPLRLCVEDGQVVLAGLDDFERRQEAFLVLMNAYFFNADHLTGMSRQEAEGVFGPGTPNVNGSKASDRYFWDAGRDVLVMEFRDSRVVFAAFVLGQ